MKTLSLAVVLGVISWIPVSGFAASSMSSIWYYETGKGSFMAEMSRQANQDDYDGLTPDGPVSMLHVYKESKGRFPKKPTFITKTVCTAMSRPPQHLQCSDASGPFSGAKFEVVVVYLEENNGFTKVNGDSSDQSLVDAGRKLLASFQKAGKSRLPWGIYRYAILRCISGCEGSETPQVMIEVSPRGGS